MRRILEAPTRLKLTKDIALKGVLFAIAGFLLSAVMVVSLRLAIGLCPLLGSRFCMGGAAYGVILLGLLVSTLFLKLTAKMPWLSCFTISLLSTAAWYGVTSSISTVYQADLSQLWFSMFFTWPVFIVVMFIVHGFVFNALAKRPDVSAIVGIVLFATYVLLVVSLQGTLQQWHQLYENQKDLKETNSLSFQIYTPTYLPAGGYRITDSNGIPAYPNSPPAYEATYSNQPIYHTVGASSLYFDEREVTKESPSSGCAAQQVFTGRIIGECKYIGRTSSCDVYNQFPSVGDAKDAQSFCVIGKTHVTLTANNGDVPVSEVLKIFNSMKPAEADVLQQEAIKNSK